MHLQLCQIEPTQLREELALQISLMVRNWPHRLTRALPAAASSLARQSLLPGQNFSELLQREVHVVPKGNSVQEGDRVMQKNEGQWQFSLDDSSDGRSIEFAVAVCRYLDTSLIRADVQPRFIRLLIQACPMSHSHAYVLRLLWHLASYRPAGAGRTPSQCASNNKNNCCILHNKPCNVLALRLLSPSQVTSRVSY